MACLGCGKSYISLNGHLARASGACAQIRVQRIINDLPTNTQGNTQEQTLETVRTNIKQKSTNHNDIHANHIIQESQNFENELTRFIQLPPENDTIHHFDTLVSKFVCFLFEANNRIPGPIHPAVEYYRKRKEKNTANNERGYKNTTNPQRSSKRIKKAISDQYKYDLAQWQYANQRRKVAQHVLNSTKTVTIKHNITAVENYFSQLYGTPNNKTLDTYEHPNNVELDDFNINLRDIEFAIKKISIDTSPGPDGIILRTIRHAKCAPAILAIAKVMLSWNYVPTKLRTGRTILIFKGKGDESDLQNWRPITIFSIIRRIIERCLDQAIRDRIKFSQLQKGFVKGITGVHINASIVEGCLKSAIERKQDVCIVMLDLSKAFDRVGHEHIKNTLNSLPIPKQLTNLVVTLSTTNSTKIEINKTRSKEINLLCGVAQGSPLSPTIFNACQDYALKQISDPDVASTYGFELSPELTKITAFAFADDTAIIAKDKKSAIEIIKSLNK